MKSNNIRIIRKLMLLFFSFYHYIKIVLLLKGYVSLSVK